MLGFDASPNTIDELLSTDVILAVGFTAAKSVMRVKLMQAAKNGAKIVLINPEGAEQELAFLHKAVYVKNDLSFLKELARALRVSRQTIGSLENGRYNPSITLAFKIARFFGLSIEEVFIYEESDE